MAQDSSPSPSPSQSLALTAAHRPNPPSQPRRVPPPCWTHEETLALIDSYHEKWYSLRRGNLKASHWQEVADAVAHRCPFASPSKTSVQCRHKIEKLRKRYRTEKQRALTTPNPNRFSSSWVFFKKMDNMEKGPNSAPDSDGGDDLDDDHDDSDDDGVQFHRPMSNGSLGGSGGGGGGGGVAGGGGGGGGFRFRIPSGPRSQPLFTKPPPPRDEKPNPNPNPSYNSNPRLWSSCTTSKSVYGGPGRNGTATGTGTGAGTANGSGSGSANASGIGVKREMDPVAEMVASIKMLGEGFVKMEQMKMEMAREMEQNRMEMEMKRTEMILDSQQRIVEAFAKGFAAKKKVKRMPSPES